MYNEHVKYMYKSAGVGILGNAFKITTLSRKILRDFKYLGVVFSRSGSFCKTKKHHYEQAQKA